MKSIYDILDNMERQVETDDDDCWSDMPGKLESLSYLVDELREWADSSMYAKRR